MHTRRHRLEHPAPVAILRSPRTPQVHGLRWEISRSSEAVPRDSRWLVAPFARRRSSATPTRSRSRAFNPDRSYTIDITGHGLRALRHIDACAYFDARLTGFKGIKYGDLTTSKWTEPGWIGTRGDIVQALTAVLEDNHRGDVDVVYESRVESLDVRNGAVTYIRPDAEAVTRQFDLVVGADGASSQVRQAIQQ